MSKNRGVNFPPPVRRALRSCESIERELARWQTPVGMAAFNAMSANDRALARERLLERIDEAIAEIESLENAPAQIQEMVRALKKRRGALAAAPLE